MNTNELTRNIWNELIAKPYNEKGSYQYLKKSNRITEQIKKVINEYR